MSGISVALAAYRGERFIAGQVASLLAQTVPPDEIVITDDSPDDLTERALGPFAGDVRIRYFRNPERLGVNGNFERALSLCRGEYLFLCDQDDVWLPEKIGTMVRVLEEDPSADGVFCDSTAVDAELRPLGYSLWRMRGFSRAMRRRLAGGDSLGVFLKRVTLSAHNIAIRRRVLPLILPYPVLEPFYSDTWIALRVASTGKWAMTERELTLYRVHGGNLSSPGTASLAEQARQSRRGARLGARGRTAELGGELLRRLPETAPEHVRSQLEAFTRHYAVRRDYPAGFFRRLGQVFREVCTGRYARCSNGWRSVAADLFLFR